MRVYVINLARSVDRRAHMTAELGRTGLTYQIITAVDGRTVDLQDSAVVDPTMLAHNDFPAGTVGCALSHLRAYATILAAGLEHALVLEDDVRLPARLGELLDGVTPHLSGAEVALLNFGGREICRFSTDGAVELPTARRLVLPIDLRPLVNAAAYVITREACERMMARALPLRANADDWQFFYREGLLDRIRCVLPMPVDKNAEFESTIGLYSLGNGLRGRLLRPLLGRRIPVVHRAILRRRERILRDWGRSELVDIPFIEKPSRLG
jgi:glycosyl transferase family 25